MPGDQLCVLYTKKLKHGTAGKEFHNSIFHIFNAYDIIPHDTVSRCNVFLHTI